jgi:AraC-like DNA-binding protein
MEIVKPRGLVSGFHADSPDPGVAAIHHIGEQWAPEDYQIPNHSHPVWEFYLQLDGWSVWEDERGRTYRCEPGVFFAPPPLLGHWLARASDVKHHFLFAAIDVLQVVRERLPSLQDAWTRDEPIFLPAPGAVESSFRQLTREVTSDLLFRSERLRLCLDPAVELAQSAMERHPAEPWHLEDLGHLAGISPNHLATLFRSAHGIGPHQYLLRVRIDLAKQGLQDPSRAITEIAHGLGFHSSQHFARVFRRLTGKTPTEYRAFTG